MNLVQPLSRLQLVGKLRIAFAVVTLAGLLLACNYPTQAAAYGGRTPGSVAAFYYPWYDILPNYNVWQARGGEMASQPSTLYHGGDVAALKRQMEQAKSAGIDAFIVTYNSYDGDWKTRLRLLLDNAPVGFSIAAHFEVSLLDGKDRNSGFVVNALRELRNNFFNHPRYFRYQGRPLLYLWRVQDLPGDVRGTWGGIRNQVDPNHENIWSADTIDLSLLDVFDTIHYFSGAKYNNNPVSDFAKLKQASDSWNSSRGGPRRLSTSSVTPGYDDSRVKGRTPEFRDRAGGAYYRTSWDAALNVQPDLVTISTWNEWYESSAIEPGRDWGNLYVDISREKIGAYKGTSLALGDASILKVWRRTDLPVLAGQTDRSWMWGPNMFDQQREPYAESPGGVRYVYYFDKSRMEINRPASNGDVEDLFYVTNGLLPIELMSGEQSTGDSQRVKRNPAQIAVAGDTSNNPNTPTYAALAGVSSYNGRNREGDRTNQLVLDTLSGSGVKGSNPGYTGRGVRLVKYINESGHNIAEPFWTFMNRQGRVWENNGLLTGPVVEWLFAMGYPISDPFWVRSKVGGTEKDVLVQAFERRILTYTPDNPEAYKVEMGNVGQHYHVWRYGS